MNRRVAAIVVGGLVALAGCTSSSKDVFKDPGTTTTAAAPAATTTPAAPATPDKQVWLCKPGLADNPCLSDLTATVVAPDGTTTIEKSAPAADPKIDCFYVYPTVSAQPTPNANLAIDKEETGVAIAQAARFSQVCRVYAPMYRQGTIASIAKRDRNSGKIALASAVQGWKDYLARYNNGRGIVFIGHSQGSFILRQLIAKYVETDPAVRSRVVSAILLGGNVLVPTGKDVGGDFKDIPACRSASQVGCVIAFSSFDQVPPPDTIFGRTTDTGMQVLCTNPAALGGGSGPVDTYEPAHFTGGPISFGNEPLAATAWVKYPDLFTAKCESSGGDSRLQITDVRKPGDTRPQLKDSLGPTWGLHIYDGNIALGSLVDIVRAEATAYAHK